MPWIEISIDGYRIWPIAGKIRQKVWKKYHDWKLLVACTHSPKLMDAAAPASPALTRTLQCYKFEKKIYNCKNATLMYIIQTNIYWVDAKLLLERLYTQWLIFMTFSVLQVYANNDMLFKKFFLWRCQCAEKGFNPQYF